MIADPRSPFRPISDRPGPLDAWRRWESAELPREGRERERFENDTLAERRALPRPSVFSRLWKRGA